jgi:formylglycine-generating enzyme required for sulfatase activity
MVGNVNEWVADWADNATNCTQWPVTFLPGSDLSCVGGPGGAGDLSLPGALLRGGNFTDGTDAGVFAVEAFLPSFHFSPFFGFRCAR